MYHHLTYCARCQKKNADAMQDYLTDLLLHLYSPARSLQETYVAKKIEHERNGQGNIISSRTTYFYKMEGIDIMIESLSKKRSVEMKVGLLSNDVYTLRLAHEPLMKEGMSLLTTI
ncbi:MAG: hypothetical protein V1725_03885 [archaeon]